MKVRNKVTCILLALTILILPNTAMMTASAEDGTWAATWTTAPINTGYCVGGRVLSDFLSNCSVRTVLTTSVGGEKIRLRFSNRYGSTDLKIEEVRVARTGTRSDTEIIDGTSLPVTFSGNSSVSIPSGKTIYSDPVTMHVECLERISVSVYYKSFCTMATGGMINALSYVETGNKVDAKTFTANAPLTLTSGSITYHTTPFLCGVDAYGKGNSCIALFGDSTLANEAPYYVAEKLVRGGETNIGVAQEAIIGNRLLYDSTGATSISNLYGEAGITRFREDVLQQAGIKAVFVKIGLNDILHPMTKSMSGKVPYASVDDIIGGYQELIRMANEAGIKIYFFSRQAWRGYERSFYGSEGSDLVWTQQADDMLAELNNWLKYSSGSNGFISVDNLKDPQDKTKLYAPYTSDGAHLTPLGARVLVDDIPSAYLTNKTLTSINEYYSNGGSDIRNYTDSSLYTKVTTTKAPASSGSAGSVQSSGSAGTQKTTIPSTTMITITNPQGAEITEVFLVEMPDSMTTPPTEDVLAPTQTDTQPTQEIKTMSKTAKVGIIIFTLLAIGVVCFGVIYGVNKKNSAD